MSLASPSNLSLRSVNSNGKVGILYANYKIFFPLEYCPLVPAFFSTKNADDNNFFINFSCDKDPSFFKDVEPAKQKNFRERMKTFSTFQTFLFET